MKSMATLMNDQRNLTSSPCLKKFQNALFHLFIHLFVLISVFLNIILIAFGNTASNGFARTREFESVSMQSIILSIWEIRLAKKNKSKCTSRAEHAS